jgi:hypothetical protein
MTGQRNVIITMAGKGGVGKSTTSVWLHQYLKHIGVPVIGFDTDPVNSTYASFKGLDVLHIDIYNKKAEIDKSLFDTLIERHLLDLPDSTTAIVDSGATTFNALLTYLDENAVIDLLREHGIQTVISSPLVGGSEHTETLKSLQSLRNQFDCKKLVWLNHFYGEMPDGDESPMEVLPLYLEDRLLGIIDIPDFNSDTFGKAINEMQKDRLTFDEFYASDHYGIMARNRIKQFKRALYENMDTALADLIAAKGCA